MPSPKRLLKIGDATYAADQILIKFKPATSDDKVNNKLLKHRLGKLSHAKAIGWRVLSVPDDVDVQALVKELNSDPDVELAELNAQGTVANSPVNDYYRGGSVNGYGYGQWNLKRIGMEGAWFWTHGAGDITIAVLDTGILPTHENLNSKILRDANGNLLGFNERGSGYPNDDDTTPAHGHGTAVAALAAAQTKFAPDTFSPGIAGVNPFSPILPVKVAASNGTWGTGDLINGINAALTIPSVKVINISLEINQNDLGVLNAINTANNQGVLVVACAGNANNGNGLFYPAAYWRTMSVCGTDINDQRTGDSVIGPQNSVSAPGGDNIFSGVVSASNNGSYSTSLSGTSFAAPLVSGLAALTLRRFPSMTWSDLKSRIEDTADGNLIEDQSFEGLNLPQGGQPLPQGTELWTSFIAGNSTYNGAGVDINVGWAHSGANEAYIYKPFPDNNWNDIRQSGNPGIPVQTNMNYRYSAWIQNSNNIPDGYFGLLGAGGQSILAGTHYYNLPSYTQLSVDFNTGPNSLVTPYAGYWVYNSIGGPSWCRYDDFSLTPLRGYDPQFGWGRINATGAVQSDAPVFLSFPQDGNSRLVSLPVWPTNQTLDRSDRSQDIQRLFPGSNGQASWWSPTLLQYLPYTDARVPRIGVGRGYWIKFSNGPSSLSYSGATAFHKPGHPAVVELGNGYNLIGTPGAQAIQWNPSTIQVRYQDGNGLAVVKNLTDAKTAGWVDDHAQRYMPDTNPAQYQNVSNNPSDPAHQIVPGEGYWLRAYVNCELLLPSN